MTQKVRKISKKWIEQTRDYFREFLNETDFPDPERLGRKRTEALLSGVVDHVHRGSVR